MLAIIKKIIPKFVFNFFSPFYHLLLAFFGAFIYGFPSRKIFVVGITGTKGKTTVSEIINGIFEEAGKKTALVNSLRFKIGAYSEKNILKMTMPGRFLIQKFLRRAADEKCDYFILETTSEGIKQYRHKFINFSAAVFTNLAPEHIESHGGFHNYKRAKLKLFAAAKKTHIVNLDSEYAEDFLSFEAKEKWGYGIKVKSQVEELKILEIEEYSLKENGIDFKIQGRGFHSSLIGEFNLYNLLAAIAFARSRDIDLQIIKQAVEKFKAVPGRMELINEGQKFKVVVDYAHTPDSLEAVYNVFGGRTSENAKLICVFGSAGGGRDKWKRPEMGRVAEKYCDEIILTNEDPYDENPDKILNQISSGFLKIQNSKFKIQNYCKILDRREAIKEAIKLAKERDIVIITGKGAEPWLMSRDGQKIPWDDREIAREELKKISAGWTVDNLSIV